MCTDSHRARQRRGLPRARTQRHRRTAREEGLSEIGDDPTDRKRPFLVRCPKGVIKFLPFNKSSRSCFPVATAGSQDEDGVRAGTHEGPRPAIPQCRHPALGNIEEPERPAQHASCSFPDLLLRRSPQNSICYLQRRATFYLAEYLTKWLQSNKDLPV